MRCGAVLTGWKLPAPSPRPPRRAVIELGLGAVLHLGVRGGRCVVIHCPIVLVIAIGVVAVMVCTVLGFIVSNVLRQEEKKPFKCICLKAKGFSPI